MELVIWISVTGEIVCKENLKDIDKIVVENNVLTVIYKSGFSATWPLNSHSFNVS